MIAVCTILQRLHVAQVPVCGVSGCRTNAAKADPDRAWKRQQASVQGWIAVDQLDWRKAAFSCALRWSTPAVSRFACTGTPTCSVAVALLPGGRSAIAPAHAAQTACSCRSGRTQPRQRLPHAANWRLRKSSFAEIGSEGSQDEGGHRA